MASANSKTGKNQAPKPKRQPNKGAFKKNDPLTGEKDERINRGGRPPLEAGFDSLRKLALSIATETAVDRYGKPVTAPDGKAMTIGETILRLMAQDPKRQQSFLEISHGKPAEIIHALIQNIDLSLLTEEQLTRVANGEDIVTVLVTTQGKSAAGTDTAAEER